MNFPIKCKSLSLSFFFVCRKCTADDFGPANNDDRSEAPQQINQSLFSIKVTGEIRELIGENSREGRKIFLCVRSLSGETSTDKNCLEGDESRLQIQKWQQLTREWNAAAERERIEKCKRMFNAGRFLACCSFFFENIFFPLHFCILYTLSKSVGGTGE